MANEAYSQAYLTGQAPDLARALAQMQYQQQQAQNYDKEIIQAPKNAGEAWLNVIPTIMRDVRLRQNNDMMQNNVIPAQQSLAEKLQSMVQRNQGSQPPRTEQDYISGMQSNAAAQDFGLPGAAGTAKAYEQAYSPAVSNSWLAGGNLNPYDQFNAQARGDLVRNQFATMSRENPFTKQPELINQAAAQQLAAQGKPVPIGAMPYTVLPDPNTGQDMAVNPAQLGSQAVNAAVPVGMMPTEDVPNASGNVTRLPKYATMPNNGGSVELGATNQAKENYKNGMVVLAELPNKVQNTNRQLNIVNKIYELSNSALPTTTGQFFSTLAANVKLESSQAAYQELEKYTKQLATLMEQSGRSTDAAALTTMKANPNAEMQPKTIREIAGFMASQLAEEQKQLRAIDKYAQQDPRNLEKISDFQRRIQKDYEPSFGVTKLVLDPSQPNANVINVKELEKIGLTTRAQQVGYMRKYINYQRLVGGMQ